MSLKDSTVKLSGTGDNENLDQAGITTAQAQKSPGNGNSTFNTTNHDGFDDQGGVGGAETRTVTRTTNLAGDNDGAVRTVTRLSTQTGIINVDVSSSLVVSSSTASQTSILISTSSISVNDTVPLVTQSLIGTNQSSTLTSPSNSSSSLSTSKNTPTGAVATSPPENGNVNQITTFTDPSGATRSMGQMMQMETSLVTMSTATNNRAEASTSSPPPENIFVPGHKLFPLGITVIVLGGLFVLMTIGIIFVRIFGWNKKRRLRLSIGSFMDVDPHSRFSPDNNTTYSYDPKFETITTNNHHIASTIPNPFEPSTPEGSSARLVERGYVDVGARKYNNDPVSTYNYPGRPPHNLDNPPINPFEPSQAVRGTSKLDVPTDVDMGSPVPSFNTGRLAYTYPNPSAYTTNPDPASSASSFVVGRNLVGPVRSNSSDRSTNSLGFGTKPSSGLGYLASQRGERRSNWSVGSIGEGSSYSTSSGDSDRIIWATNGLPAYIAQNESLQGGGKLG